MSSSLIIGGRRVDSVYNETNTNIPAETRAPDDGFGTFTILASPKDAELPVILGEGALFGPVVEAELGDGKPVAVKTYLALEHSDRSTLLRIAKHEYRRGTADLGPLFVRARALLESSDHSGETLFLLVMDKVNGYPLNRLTGSEIPASRQRDWLTDGIEALRILIAEEFIQQDLKPANIMETQAGLVFIDHGSIRAPSARSEPNEHSTLSYSAPEFGDTKQFTEEGMIFSLGLTLLEVFTKGYPYVEEVYNRATSLDDKQYLHRTELGTLNLDSEELSAETSEALKIMTSKDPTRRRLILEDNRWARTERGERTPTANLIEPTTASWDNSGSDSSALNSSVPLSNLPPLEPLPPTPAARKRTSNAEELPQLNLDLLPYPSVDLPKAEKSRRIDGAGVDSTFVVEAYERRNYGYIGVALIVYRLYIILGVLVLGHQMSGSWEVGLLGAALAGPILGQALVNFDRSIVNSIQPNLSKLHEDEDDDTHLLTKGFAYWSTLLIRVLATLLVAFLVGSALDVQLHRRDVMAELEASKADMRAELETEVEDTYADRIETEKDTFDVASAALLAAEGKAAELRLDATAERLGDGPTGIPGCPPGSRCQALLDQAEVAETADNSNLEKEVADAVDAQEATQTEITEFKAPRLAVIDRADGPAAQANALWDIAQRDTYILVTSIALIALFMTIELFAVLMKLSTSGNRYELAQARNARIHELIAVENGNTTRAHILQISAKNKEIIEDLVAVQGASKTLFLADRANDLYPDRSAPLARSDGGLTASSRADTASLAALTESVRPPGQAPTGG